MQFFKKHYEKILLSLGLVALLGAVGFLLLQVKGTKDYLEKVGQETGGNGAPKKPAPIVNEGELTLILDQVRKPLVLNLQSNHVFNPSTWKIPSTNTNSVLIKADNLGPSRLNILKITPLYLIIDGVVDNTDPTKPTYRIGFSREYEKDFRKRGRLQRTATLNTLTRLDVDLMTITLKSVEGGQFTADLKTPVETLNGIIFTAANPFRRVMGYEVDLEYPNTKQTFLKRRETDEFILDGESYNIVAIREKEVTIEAKSNKKRWTVIPKPSP